MSRTHDGKSVDDGPPNMTKRKFGFSTEGLDVVSGPSDLPGAIPQTPIATTIFPEDTTNPKDRLGLAKVPLRLVPSALMIWAAMAFKDGAQKYGAYNWRGKAVRYTVYTEAAQRHILQAFDGEDVDPASRCKHLGHAIACLGIILDAEATGNLVDDRPPAGSASKLIEQLTEKTK